MSVKTRIAELNTHLAEKLTAKGVEADASETTTALIDKVDSIAPSDSYYDAFWDAFQQNGERTAYKSCFYGVGWTDYTFKPKYLIKPGNCENMFTASQITELPAGIVDWSNCAGYSNYAFMSCTQLKIIHEPIITAKMTRFNGMFQNCYALETVSFKGRANGNWSATFAQCTNLKNVRFIDSTISGGIPIGFASCSLLTNESVQSIIDALIDLTGSTAKTIAFHSDVVLNLSDEQLQTIHAKNWQVG